MGACVRERLRALEEQVAALERTIAELRVPRHAQVSAACTAATPVTFVDTAGRALVEISADLDGGVLRVLNSDGEAAVVLGCLPMGGFLDILHVASGGRLVVTLEATDSGGRIEVTDAGGESVFSWPAVA
jgi:hypothetical protein